MVVYAYLITLPLWLSCVVIIRCGVGYYVI